MLLNIIIAVLFVAVSHCYTEAFFAQRAHLEISRMINFDLHRVIKLEWLKSYRGVKACQYFRWAILIAAYYFCGWKVPVGFYVMEQLYMTFRPLPDRSYQEVMDWFRIASKEDKSLMDLYINAQTILRRNGVSV